MFSSAWIWDQPQLSSSKCGKSGCEKAILEIVVVRFLHFQLSNGHLWAHRGQLGAQMGQLIAHVLIWGSIWPNCGSRGPNCATKGPSLGAKGPTLGSKGPTQGSMGPIQWLRLANIGHGWANMGQLGAQRCQLGAQRCQLWLQRGPHSSKKPIWGWKLTHLSPKLSSVSLQLVSEWK